ncbi:MAG: hypothetical protein PHO62_07835 [Sulfurimonas sp.]|uniref:hypothetical protein n=1 Tax=Sulfurimonas sp. TaxID=2022749 RepID=UPI00260A2016|nr:hypothetical protein [Sulfurimonas sp.]MDD5373317.1 hypothetical protein [Sulfurimonas sp.]
MTGIEFALQQLAVKIAKNGFNKIMNNNGAGKPTAKKAVEIAEDFDFFGIGDGVKDFVRERVTKEKTEREERLNRETLDISEAFFKKRFSPSLSVADKNKKPPFKKKSGKKKGK